LRFGTPAITTRGVKENEIRTIVDLIDKVLEKPTDENNIASVRKQVNEMMAQYPLFAY
jgi:glycine hydroxymethyltransferase